MSSQASHINAVASSSTSVAKQPPGKKKRSRSGCGTCKTRRKKCDENFTNGTCQRCLTGNFQCSMETLRPSRSAAVQGASKSTPPIRRGKPIRKPSSSPATSPEEPATDVPMIETAAPSIISDSASASTSVLLPLPAPSHFLPYSERDPIQTVNYPPPPPIASPSQLQHFRSPNLSIITSSSQPPIPAYADNSDLPSPFLKPNELPSSSAWYHRPDDDQTYHDSPPPEELQLINSPNDAIAYGRYPRRPDPSGQFDNDGRLAVGLSEVLEIRAFSEQWRGFYESLNDSYFHSIPMIPRARVKHLMDLFLTGNDSSRAGMSTWCASHYGWILSKSGDPNSQLWMTKANRFYQEGLRSLQDTRYSMYVRLGTILDLRIAQVQHWGGALAYVLLLLGENIINETIGHAPIINISLLDSVGVINLRSFIWLEVIASVCIYKRPVPYQLVVSGPCSFVLPNADEAGVDVKSLSVHLSLPVELLICLAEISNLSCLEGTPEFDERRIKAKAKDIEKVILAFKTSVVSSEDPAVDLAVQELWRHATLIYLYQTIHHHLPLSSKFTSSLTAILTHSGVLPRIATSSEPKVQTALFGASTALPWFLAGTVATSPQDREICRTALKEVGYGPTYEGNLGVVERVWEVTAQSGWTPCWRKLVQDEGLVVAFL